MSSTSGRAASAAIGVFAGLAMACSESPVQPEAPSVLVVAVQSAGSAWDVDGFQLSVGDAPPRQLFANASAIYQGLPAGAVQVALGDVGEHCTVDGDNPRSATVTPGKTLRVQFVVTCMATGVAVTARTSGPDHPTLYRVTVDGESLGTVSADGVSEITTAAGTRSVVLTGFAENCTVAGEAERVVEVAIGRMTPLSFDVTCSTLVRVPRIAFVDSATVQAGSWAQPWVATVRPDGTGAMRLFPGSAPDWAPDGMRLVFTTTQCIDDGGAWYGFWCDGGLAIGDPYLMTTQALVGGTGGLVPTWAPTDGSIAFLWPESMQSFVAYSIRIGDAGPTPMGVIPGGGASRIAWSPDGQRLAFACPTAPAGLQLCVAGRSGGDVARVTASAGAKLDPSWSPDGGRIAFTALTSDAARVAVLTLATGEVTYLTTGAEPDWSPDGSRLVFADRDGLFTVAADGTDRQRLTTGRHFSPAWRP